MTSLAQAASRRNTVALAERTGLYVPSVSESAIDPRSISPGAALVHRLTRRPIETCETIARLAGFRDMEADNAR